MILLTTAWMLTIAAATTVLIPNHSTLSGEGFFDNCKKIWSHRTMGSGGGENTVEGLRDVLSLGVGGVEIDIYYDEKRDRLYVQSEEYRSADVPLALSLAEMLAAVPSGSRLWLDFWNLRQLNEVVAPKAISRLASDIRDADLGQHVIIESTSASLLHELHAAKLRTSLWVQIAEPDDSAAGLARHVVGALRARYQLFTAPASAVSLDHQQYSQFVGIVFTGVPILLFTINDKLRLIAAAKDSHVKAILTDEPFLHKEDTCSK